MRYYGQFDPPVDKVIFDAYFINKRNGFFIECGAYDGIVECSCKLFEDLGWTGLNVEASPRIFQRLIQNRPNSRNVNVALSDTIGNQTFHDISSPTGIADGNGSLMHCAEHKALLVQQGCGTFPVTVAVTTYAQLMKDQNIAHVDLLVLDVEGHELQVLSGMMGCPTLPDVMCIEFPFTGLDNITKKVSELGYRLDFLKHNNAHYVRR
jgi:FkbM family methyltransferase